MNKTILLENKEDEYSKEQVASCAVQQKHSVDSYQKHVAYSPLKSISTRLLIHAYDLYSVCMYLSQTGLLLQVENSAPPSVCHIKMEESRKVSFSKAQQAIDGLFSTQLVLC